MTKRQTWWLGAALLLGCEVGGTVGITDAGPPPVADAGETDAGSALCAVACGGVCCNASEECVGDRCLPSCGEANRCGAEGACCDAGELCVNEICTAPGVGCVDDLDCAEDAYCDLGLDRCLPRPTYGFVCEVRPPENEFDPELVWSWDEGATVVSPLVVRLSDDDGDGRIDSRDGADVITVAFFPEAGREWRGIGEPSARVVALDGADGSELWRSPEGIEVCVSSTPAVADLDGDGTVEIAAVVASTSTTNAIDGQPSNCSGWFNILQVPLAIAIFSHEGALEALSDPDEVALTGHQAPAVAVADLDGDGDGEIVVQGAVIDHDAQLVWRVPGSETTTENAGWFVWPGSDMPILTNVDDDPELEIVTYHGVWNHDGTPRWTRPFGENAEVVGTLVGEVVRTEGAPEAQLVITRGGSIEVLDAATGDVVLDAPFSDALPDSDGDGYPDVCDSCASEGEEYDGDGNGVPDCDECLAAVQSLSGYAGQPALADFDGDGVQEVGFGLGPLGDAEYLVVDLSSGTADVELRDRVLDGTYASVSSTVFDFDGNGSAEIVIQDECHVRIRSGATGSTLWASSNTSITASEYPVVADVTGDGRANLVVGSNWIAESRCADRDVTFTGSTQGVRVFRDRTDRWIDARPIWNQHTYHIDNVEDDGGLPRQATGPWTRHNTFRLNRYPNPETVFHAPDLVIEAVQARNGLCYGDADLAVRVVNRGYRTVPAGVRVVFSADRGAGDEVVSETTTDAPLGPGAGLWLVFQSEGRELPVDEEGRATLRITLDPDDDGAGRVLECVEDNNEVSFPIDCSLI